MHYKSLNLFLVCNVEGLLSKGYLKDTFNETFTKPLLRKQDKFSNHYEAFYHV